MALVAGTRLGPYEIVDALGAGGMGEVYRAHDSRLGRDVAVKVLPEAVSADAERLARFEQEARAVAALNHPNILSVFDIGDDRGTRYIVSELLEGETLRNKLGSGLLPVRRVVEYALQITQGLAAAHGKGIVHRDLKPENIFISKDGRAKILDFGLAKQNALAASADSATMTAMAQTTPGMMVGTIGYMSPEQVRGKVADHRSDIFSFGAMLHEMLSGERPFRRDTSADTVTAILKEELPELVSTTTRMIPPGVERIVRRCLEKDPEQRFQSARDLAFALEALSSATSTSTTSAPINGGARRFSIPMPAAIGAAAVLLALAVFGAIAFLRTSKIPSPTFRQLTSSRGYMRMARFTPDGQTVVFGGAWNGEPLKLFFQRTDANVFSPLTVADADLLAVSSTGELAIALRRSFAVYDVPVGTLARSPLSGGSPREVLENVEDADWGTDGTSFAVTRAVGDRFRLEYPIGKVLYENSGYISHIRLSHRGDKIAFMDHPLFGDDRGYISVVDLSGKKTVLTREWAGEQGLAWAPDDSEIWFTASDEESGNFYVLRAVTLSGKVRVVLRAPASLRLHDIAQDGTVLLGTDSTRNDVTMGDVSSGKVTDLTWFDHSWNQALSEDGKWVTFSTQGSGFNTNYSVYVRKTDGSPAIRLGDGSSQGFSPDGKWIASMLPAAPHLLQLLPTGAGELRILKSEKVNFTGIIAWTPDGKNLVVVGYEQGRGPRTYLQSVDGGEPKPITPEGLVGQLLSPDGKSLLARDLQGKALVYALEGGEPREVHGISSGEIPIRWQRDGRTLIVREKGETAVSTYQLDLESGVKKPWKRFLPNDKVGLISTREFQVTPDGSHYLMVYWHMYSTLFVVKGLK
jgi:serine/threonine protein kinase/Tol biopolymer transport system component